MARKTMSGLYQRNGIWHIDKVVRGSRLQESTGASEREEAEQYLIHRLEKLRQEKIYGVRQVRTWRTPLPDSWLSSKTKHRSAFPHPTSNSLTRISVIYRSHTSMTGPWPHSSATGSSQARRTKARSSLAYRTGRSTLLCNVSFES